jgi:hypothetical protein
VGLTDDVRSYCAEVAAAARWVTIGREAMGAVEPGPPPALDPECHFLEGTREEVSAPIDAEELLPPGPAEREIRACAVHAGEIIAPRPGVPPAALDHWLWNRGQAPRYKERPRHRTRSVFY